MTTLPPRPAARSRLILGDFGPSDCALAAARGGRLRRPAAERHAARYASRDLCSGVRPLALYALDGFTPERFCNVIHGKILGVKHFPLQ